MPVKVGVLSSVVSPLTIGPFTAPTSSLNSATALSGATVSTVIGYRPVCGLILPAALVAVADKLCRPSFRSVSGVKLQLPLSSALAVPSNLPLL
ncbi:hypothetical protein PchlR47_15990 [Pseudomonas chlororaphis]|nr:hypothetical protein PchlR47_15990 [Pseudomonas chlororaphis]